MQETQRRRTLQQAHNQEHGIIPRTVKREVSKTITDIQKAIAQASERKRSKKQVAQMTPEQARARIIELEGLMKIAAEELDFEKAISMRDEWIQLKKLIE